MERRKHSTIKAGDYLYMLGGWQSGLPKVHGSEKKKSMSSVMELCHFPSGRWKHKPTLVLIHWVSEVMQLLLLEMKYFIMPVDSSTVVILVVIITVYTVSMFIPLYGRSYISYTTSHHGPMLKYYSGMVAVYNSMVRTTGYYNLSSGQYT